MATIKPFCGVRYSRKNISHYVCPPYDVISAAEKKLLEKKSKYNCVRLELPDVYSEARTKFDTWKRHGILKRDTAPAFYLYTQEFRHEGKKYIRNGLFALVKAEKFGKNIFPHEKTHKGPKIDRLNLLKATGLNISPVFFLFPDTGNFFQRLFLRHSKQEPINVSSAGGVTEKMWAVTADVDVKWIRNYLAGKKLFIADGHHRYETFLNFAPNNFMLAFICPFESPGLLVLPTHRIFKSYNESADIAGMRKFFNFRKVDYITNLSDKEIGFHYKNKFFILSVKSKKITTGIEYLHKTFLKNKTVEYTKNLNEGIEKTKNSGFLFIISPLKVKELKNVISTRKVLPQKSTYFYPKVTTGFVFNEVGKNNCAI
ncbi:MAG: hypothetical protein BWY26_01044 [Elusimicrobia bacterium ADurb.Bin231]|nr:MAG: hypothetical protein BWY26_01044 [Elusimicrobia bacterium ADurb.Bin231]